MIKNYFFTAWRSILRNKAFTLINILGLSVGISAALVIYLVVSFQYSFDKFEPGHDRIYRVVSNMSFNGTPAKSGGVQTTLADVVRREVSGVGSVCQFLKKRDRASITVPDTRQKPALPLQQQDGIMFADASYLKFISFFWLAGSVEQALNSPGRVVITENRARLYFPGLNPQEILGRRIIYQDSILTTVTGVVRDLPANTEFAFHDLISLSTVNSTRGLKEEYNWGNWKSTPGSSQLFLVLNPLTHVSEIETQLKAIAKKYIPQPKEITETFKTTFRLQPLSDIHFNSDYENLNGQQASRPVLTGLILVALILLVLACINFINLNTAQGSKRAREIGIRKTLGVTSGQLLAQLLGEPFLLTVFSTMLSLAITPVLLKVFEDFTPPGLDVKALLEPQLPLFVLILVITITLLAGFYPSMVLSSYNPVLALKNQAKSMSTDTRAGWTRKALNIAQFATAQVFILFTLIVVKQIRYSIDQNPGFKKSAIISVRTPYLDKRVNNRLVFVSALRELPGIEMVSLGWEPAASDNINTNGVSFKDSTHSFHSSVQMKYGDTNYLKLYHIPIIAGRTARVSDTMNEVVINETFAHLLGFKYATDAVNKSLFYGSTRIPITGVMGDIHQESLHEKIKPLMFGSDKQMSYIASIALKPQIEGGQQWKTTIKEIGLRFNKLYPDQEFDYEFLDQSIKKFYDADTKISALLTWATGIAIFISCLGLLGLVMFTTTSRTKEVGIRKILGASVTQIMTLLTRDFLTPVFLAFLIALPIALWVSSNWLRNFAYRTTIDWWVFVLSFGAIIFLALITLSFQTIRAATANPVDSLRIE